MFVVVCLSFVYFDNVIVRHCQLNSLVKYIVVVTCVPSFCRRACNPVDLFEAAVQKRCLDDFVNIKVMKNVVKVGYFTTAQTGNE